MKMSSDSVNCIYVIQSARNCGCCFERSIGPDCGLSRSWRLVPRHRRCTGDSTFGLSTLQAVCDILLTSSMSGHMKELGPKLDLLAFITTWRKLETTWGVTKRLNGVIVRELSLLAQRASCSLPQDKVYGIIGLFPSAMSSTVVIDYSRETAVILAEFCSIAYRSHFTSYFKHLEKAQSEHSIWSCLPLNFKWEVTSAEYRI